MGRNGEPALKRREVIQLVDAASDAELRAALEKELSLRRTTHAGIHPD